MATTILPLLIALVALIALDVLSVRFGADTTPGIDDTSDWI
jgi:hypothetical protein